jgi:hypothetical protein
MSHVTTRGGCSLASLISASFSWLIVACASAAFHSGAAALSLQQAVSAALHNTSRRAN